jgi:hypothetical protein
MDSELTLTIDVFGTKKWRNKQWNLHRSDGPAIEYSSGSEEWYENGLRHRLNGPAETYKNGFKHWYFMGMRHREDGPAAIYSDGSYFWFLNDILYRTKESYFNALSEEAKAKCLFSEDFLNG